MAVILVIDDYDGFREAMAYCLPRFGHSALVAADGAAGLRLAASTPVDLVLLSIGYREQSGFAACGAFKRDEKLRRIPVVLMADTVNAEMLARARAVGAEQMVTKPIEWQAFLALLARIAPENERGGASDATA